jgi:hypothetical protein
MRTFRLLPFAAVLVGLFVGVGSAHAAVKHTWRVNLDGDRHVEKVELIQKRSDGFPKRWLVIEDRVHGHPISRRITPRLWFLSRSHVRIADLNAHPKRLEIFYVGYIGGTAGSPTYAGIKGWDGHHLHTFFSYAPPYPKRRHGGRSYSYDGASVKLEQIASGNEPAFEISLNEGEINGDAPLCCPQFVMTRLYRYDRGERSWVVYGKKWTRVVE